ncbi:MAG: quinolinate synthase NadA [bacterium]
MPETFTLNELKYNFSALPREYWELPDAERDARTAAAKRKLGKDLLILTHNYQRDAVFKWADYTGDSYQLSKYAAEDKESKFIVFCGVSFMAETVDILCEGRKRVILPSMEASCPMAGMAEVVQVQKAWDELSALVPESDVIPITYINSYADLKAFVANRGGAVCTSSNALAIFKWALAQKAGTNGASKRVFFYPDQNLAINMWVKAGQPDHQAIVWNPWNPHLGGNTPEAVERARLYMWRGFCQVHDRFKPEHVYESRAKHPGIKVLVHPECPREVVAIADVVGSTSQIIKTVETSPPGSQWAIGTEFNLVNRLKHTHPEQFIMPLGCEVCIDCNAMRQVDPNYLLWVLEELADGRVQNLIQVDADDAKWARIALDRMLKIV